MEASPKSRYPTPAPQLQRVPWWREEGPTWKLLRLEDRGRSFQVDALSGSEGVGAAKRSTDWIGNRRKSVKHACCIFSWQNSQRWRCKIALRGYCRCNEGTGESLLSLSLSELPALSGVQKLKNINPVTFQATLKDKPEPQNFNLSRKRTVPRLLLHLSVGPLDLSASILCCSRRRKYTEYKPLIRRAALNYLGVDSETMLESNRAQLNDTSCTGAMRDTKSVINSCRSPRWKVQRLTEQRSNLQKTIGKFEHGIWSPRNSLEQ